MLLLRWGLALGPLPRASAGLRHRAGLLDGSLGTVGEPPEGSCSSHPGSDVGDQLAGPRGSALASEEYARRVGRMVFVYCARRAKGTLWPPCPSSCAHSSKGKEGYLL
jgi:hypothetical protein